MGILQGAEMTVSYIAHSIYRFIQIVLALAVCGLYGVDLNKADKEHKYSDGKWVCLSSPPPPPLSLFSNNPIATPIPEATVADARQTGLRRNRRLPLRLPRPPLPNPLLLAHPLHVHRRHAPLHPLDRALRAVRKHVYSCECAGRLGDYQDEACGVG